VLGADSARSLDAEQRLQLDRHNGQAARLLPGLIAGVDRQALEPSAREALQVLEAWSTAPVNGPDAAGALLYEHWYLALADELLGAALPPALLQRLLASNYLLNQALDRTLLDDGRSPWWRADREALLTRAFADAAGQVADGFGADPAGWRWDAALTVHVDHELGGAVPLLSAWLNRGPYAWGGGTVTVGRARFRYHRPFEVRSAATLRVVAELGDPIRVRAIMPGGQSGHPASAHYADQLPRWLEGALDELPARAPAAPAAVMQLVPAPARPAR
jgi:penicillin amidase